MKETPGNSPIMRSSYSGGLRLCIRARYHGLSGVCVLDLQSSAISLLANRPVHGTVVRAGLRAAGRRLGVFVDERRSGRDGEVDRRVRKMRVLIFVGSRAALCVARVTTVVWRRKVAGLWVC